MGTKDYQGTKWALGVFIVLSTRSQSFFRATKSIYVYKESFEKITYKLTLQFPILICKLHIILSIFIYIYILRFS
jgi:hypothetical protein